MDMTVPVIRELALEFGKGGESGAAKVMEACADRIAALEAKDREHADEHADIVLRRDEWHGKAEYYKAETVRLRADNERLKRELAGERHRIALALCVLKEHTWGYQRINLAMVGRLREPLSEKQIDNIVEHAARKGEG